jgi:O-antigen biosynthesis protein
MNNFNIIILTYNNLDSTKQCLENLYKYTKDFNLLIFDNNSTDETMRYLIEECSSKKFSIVPNNKNIGIIKGRNKGYSFAQKIYPDAEHILFLDNDQFVLPGWQESYIDLFEQGYDILGCEAWLMRKDFYPYKRITDKNEDFSYIGAGGMMLRASVLKELKCFDESYGMAYYEDPDLCWRAYEAGYRVGWNYNNKIEHQKHNLSLRGDRKRYFMENWKKFQERWQGKEMPVFKMD